MEASSHRHDQSLTQFLVLFPSRRIGGGDESSKPLPMAYLSGDRTPSRSPPRVALMEQTFLSLRKFQGDLGALCQELGSKAKYQNKRHTEQILGNASLRKSQKFWELCTRHWGQRPDIYFQLFHTHPSPP